MEYAEEFVLWLISSILFYENELPCDFDHTTLIHHLSLRQEFFNGLKISSAETNGMISCKEITEDTVTSYTR